MRRPWLKLFALSGWLLAAVFAWLYFTWPSPAADQLRDEMRHTLVRAQALTEMEAALAAARFRESEAAASLLRSDKDLADLKQQQTHAKLAEQAALAEANRLRAELQAARSLSEQRYAELLRLRREIVSQSIPVAVTAEPSLPVPAQVPASPFVADAAILSLSEDGLVCALALGSAHGLKESDSLALHTPGGQARLVVTGVYPTFVLVRVASKSNSSVELQLGQNYSIYRI